MRYGRIPPSISPRPALRGNAPAGRFVVTTQTEPQTGVRTETPLCLPPPHRTHPPLGGSIQYPRTLFFPAVYILFRFHVFRETSRRHDRNTYVTQFLPSSPPRPSTRGLSRAQEPRSRSSFTRFSAGLSRTAYGSSCAGFSLVSTTLPV